MPQSAARRPGWVLGTARLRAARRVRVRAPEGAPHDLQRPAPGPATRRSATRRSERSGLLPSSRCSSAEWRRDP